MNTELLEKIAAQIEETPDLYRQHVWALNTECGTAHCIAGWAVRLGLGDEVADRRMEAESVGAAAGSWSRSAGEVLGLDSIDSSLLFNGTFMQGAPASIVAEALRMLARGDGELVWDNMSDISTIVPTPESVLSNA